MSEIAKIKKNFEDAIEDATQKIADEIVARLLEEDEETRGTIFDKIFEKICKCGGLVRDDGYCSSCEGDYFK